MIILEAPLHLTGRTTILPHVGEVTIGSNGTIQVEDEEAAKNLVAANLGYYEKGSRPEPVDELSKQLTEASDSSAKTSGGDEAKEMSLFFQLVSRLQTLEEKVRVLEAYSHESAITQPVVTVSDSVTEVDLPVTKDLSSGELTEKDKELIDTLNKMGVNELRTWAKDIGFPESEWEGLSRAKLREYLISKALSEPDSESV